MSIEIDTEVESFNLDTMIPLGLISAELIINSSKYGVINGQSLAMKIALKKGEDKILNYIFSDNGPGLETEENNATQNGMGTIVLRSMTRQLNGSYTINSDHGYEFDMHFMRKVTAKI